MAFKDLLVHADEAEGTTARLRLAADLARRHAGHLTALYVRELSPAQIEMRAAAELGLAPPAGLDRLDQRLKSSLDAAAERLHGPFEALRREFNIEVAWRMVDGTASVVVPQHARYADLCIVGRDRKGGAGAREHNFTEQLLLRTGRPVLFIPASDGFATLGRHVVVAWNSSRATARSLSDALPLIERAERTTVLTINAEDFEDEQDDMPAEHLIAHLRHHNRAIDAVDLENISAGSIAEALQGEARRLGADVIVAGAFGHPKLWEKLVGGVTRNLLDRMTMPVLMSH